MKRWLESILLTIVLASSCVSAVESSSETGTLLHDWTACVNSSGFEELQLSGASAANDGLSVESRSFLYRDNIELEPHLEITIDEGHIRELRITFEEVQAVSLDSLYNDLHAQMNTLYGQAVPTDAYSTWRASTSNGTLMEIELMDARPLFQREEIILHWKEHTDRLYED